MTTVAGCPLCARPGSEWLLDYTGVDPDAEGTRERRRLTRRV